MGDLKQAMRVAPLWTVEMFPGDRETSERWWAEIHEPGHVQVRGRRHVEGVDVDGYFSETHEHTVASLSWDGQSLQGGPGLETLAGRALVRATEDEFRAIGMAGHVRGLRDHNDARAAAALLAPFGVRPETLARPEFRTSLCLDARRQLLVPIAGHVHPLPLADRAEDMGHPARARRVGYEVAGWGRERAGQDLGRHAGAWCSVARPSDVRLVLVTSALEALSHQQLHPHASARYLALGTARAPGGGLTQEQEQMVRLCIAAAPRHSTVLLGFGHSALDRRRTEEVRALVPSVALLQEAPPLGRTWNEALQRLERDFIRAHAPTHQRRAPVALER